MTQETKTAAQTETAQAGSVQRVVVRESPNDKLSHSRPE